MKKKPDTMVTMVLLFLLGLAVTGFSSLSVGADDARLNPPQQVSLY